jgi:hypothetical protein
VDELIVENTNKLKGFRMNQLIRCFIVFLFLLIIVSYLPAQNVSISDYQVPVSSAKQLRLNADWSWGQTGDVPTANTLNGALLYKTFYSSLPFAWFVNANGTTNKTLDSNWLYTTHADAEIRKYLWDNQDWFGSGGLTFDYAKNDSQPDVNARLAGGYGRYIDATALAKAVRIEDHLLKENAIKDHMPKETMIKIANIIEREQEFKDLYGSTYEVQWFAAIEKEVKDSGVLVGENLGAIGLYRIRQVLFAINEIVNPRYYGWDVSAGIEKKLLDRYKADLGPAQLSLQGDYAYPIDWSMQANGKVKVNTPVDSSFFKRIIISAQLDYLYELSNKINFTATYNLLYDKPMNVDAIKSHTFTAGFLFYIENNINYGFNASYSQVGDGSSVKAVSMTLQYNLFY